MQYRDPAKIKNRLPSGLIMWISAYPSIRALSQASIARFTGRPQ